MIYAVEGPFKIPLGVHLGAANSWKSDSALLGLEAFAATARELEVKTHDDRTDTVLAGMKFKITP